MHPSSLMDTTTNLEEQRLLLGVLGLGVHIHLAMLLKKKKKKKVYDVRG